MADTIDWGPVYFTLWPLSPSAPGPRGIWRALLMWEVVWCVLIRSLDLPFLAPSSALPPLTPPPPPPPLSLRSPVLSGDGSGGSDLTMSPSTEERVPMRRSSTPEQERRSGGTCFLLAASDYTCPADGGVRKTGTAPPLWIRIFMHVHQHASSWTCLFSWLLFGFERHGKCQCPLSIIHSYIIIGNS